MTVRADTSRPGSTTVARSPASATRVGRRLLLRLGQRWLTFAVAVLCWEALARLAASSYFPPPTGIAAEIHRLWLSGPASHAFLTERAVGNIGASLARALGGWVIAATIGIALGVALGRSKRALDYAHPLLEFGRVLPPPALVPVFLVLFGIGTPMQLALIVFGVVWPVLLNAKDGARFVEPTYADTARVFQVPPLRWMLRIVLPAAGPKIFAGLRVSLSIALILMVISEMVGSLNGVGREIMVASRSFEYTGMWAGIVLLGVLGYILNAALLATENQVLSWHRGARQLDE